MVANYHYSKQKKSYYYYTDCYNGQTSAKKDRIPSASIRDSELKLGSTNSWDIQTIFYVEYWNTRKCKPYSKFLAKTSINNECQPNSFHLSEMGIKSVNQHIWIHQGID